MPPQECSTLPSTMATISYKLLGRMINQASMDLFQEEQNFLSKSHHFVHLRHRFHAMITS